MSYKSASVYTGSEWVTLGVSVTETNQRTVSTVSATSYTLASSDNGKCLVFTNSSDITLTVPNDTSQNYVVGQTFMIVQKGSGKVTVQGESPAVIHSLSSHVKTSGQYAEARLIKIAANEWLLSGDLTA